MEKLPLLPFSWLFLTFNSHILGFYRDALKYFAYSVSLFGHTTDVFYNKAICHYQLREDALFLETVKEAKMAFPDFVGFQQLDKLDLGAK